MLTYTSVGIAFALLMCILIYHIYLRLLQISALKSIFNAIQGLCKKWKGDNNNDDKQESTGPTTSSIRLLESLLESK